ncbi:MAG TPA: S41 family peptidase [Mucilaginibacter sp.]
MKKLIVICLFLIVLISFAQAQDSLKYSKQQVAGDIALLISSAADIHPNLYHDISRQQLTNKIDSLVKTLPDSLSDLTAYRTFAEATAFINEGHTGINIPKLIRAQRKAGVFKTIPLQAVDFNGHYFLANIISPNLNLKGIKVTVINGKTSADIFKQMMALRGGLPAFRKASVIANFRIYLAALGITQPYLIDYIDQQSQKQQVEVTGITESEYVAATTVVKDTKNYTFNIVNNAYGYLNFKWMDNYDGFKRFCDSVFRVMDEQDIHKLIIDLRENGGGNSALGRLLLDYITITPYRMAGESERKVSQGFKDHIMANKNLYGNNYDDLLKMPNGAFLKIGNDDFYKPEDRKYRYKGKVCFLIGSNTFSSANMLSATIKDFKLATLIGEPTGEPGNDYGELCDIKLPQTGFIAFTSTTLWVRPNNDKTDNKPIYPDYIVQKSPSGDDNVLKFAVGWLAK